MRYMTNTTTNTPDKPKTPGYNATGPCGVGTPESDRYAVIVVSRKTGDPVRLLETFEGEEGAERAHATAERRNASPDHVAFVVGLR